MPEILPLRQMEIMERLILSSCARGLPALQASPGRAYAAAKSGESPSGFPSLRPRAENARAGAPSPQGAGYARSSWVSQDGRTVGRVTAWAARGVSPVRARGLGSKAPEAQPAPARLISMVHSLRAGAHGKGDGLSTRAGGPPARAEVSLQAAAGTLQRGGSSPQRAGGLSRPSTGSENDGNASMNALRAEARARAGTPGDARGPPGTAPDGGAHMGVWPPSAALGDGAQTVTDTPLGEPARQAATLPAFLTMLQQPATGPSACTLACDQCRFINVFKAGISNLQASSSPWQEMASMCLSADAPFEVVILTRARGCQA